MVQADTLTLTTLLVDVRSRLLEALARPASGDNQARLNDLWRVCLTIHDLARARGDGAYVTLMERMIDSVADYHQYGQPETFDWTRQVPSVAEIEAAAPPSG
jgi:hypothetical protein